MITVMAKPNVKPEDFKDLRERCGLSQARLAAKFDCSPTYIWHVERGDWGTAAGARALRDALWNWLVKYEKKLTKSAKLS
jgi:transcriptional regulator with XRE-family HTH domain